MLARRGKRKWLLFGTDPYKCVSISKNRPHLHGHLIFNKVAKLDNTMEKNSLVNNRY